MKIATCSASSCRARIIWTETVNGKRMPLDEEPTEGGSFRIDETREPPIAEYVKNRANGELLHAAHWSTCPDAIKFRKAPSR